jgi:hypothetical protein
MDNRLNLEQYLELLLGPAGTASAFADEAARLAAWREHAPDLLPMVSPGSRPWAWWQYDAPEPPLPREPEIAYLERCRALTDTERLRLASAGLYPASQATRNP